MIKRSILLLLLVGVGANLVYQFQRFPHLSGLFSPAYWQQIGTVGDVMRLVHTHYVDEERVGYDRLAQAAMAGMLGALDPYSSYIPKQRFEAFEEEAQKQYVGIGIEIERIERRITVVTPFEGGPAQESGVLSGDQIVDVGGVNTENFTLPETISLLRGSSGSEVRLRLYRPSTDRYLEVTLMRRFVNLASVRNVGFSDGIGYLRINQFGEQTSAECARTLASLEKQGMEGLIIDLRNNSGGLLRAAVDVASEFLPQGELVVSTEGRTAKENDFYRADRGSEGKKGYSIVVLINGDSASAAEIVAGALQDAEQAVILGERSYGKGSVQSVYSLRSGDGVRQTTAIYRTPEGRNIEEIGIEPDVAIAVDPNDYARLRMQRRHLGFMTQERFRKEFGFTPIPDRQLQAARDPLKGKPVVGDRKAGEA